MPPEKALRVRVAASMLLLFLLPKTAIADLQALEPLAIAEHIATRVANEGRVGRMHFRLVNSSGAVRERVALMAHSELAELTRIAIYFRSPGAIAGTAFLSHDYALRDDDVWVYLPATERVRRLPASQRGDYFLGTDLTYGDVKSNFKFELSDWVFTQAGHTAVDGKPHYSLQGSVRDSSVAKELGYSSFDAIVDPLTWFPVVIHYSDADGDPLKRIQILEQGLVGGAWTALRFAVDHQQTGHRTEVHFTDMRYEPDLPSGIFDPQELEFGVPEVGF